MIILFIEAAQASQKATAEELRDPAKADIEEDEEDEDFLVDEEEEEEEEESEPPSNFNPQEATNSSTPDLLTKEVNKMSLSTKKYSMDVSFPYLMYDYVEDGRERVTIDFLVFGTAKKNLRPAVASGGNELHLKVVIPEIFTVQSRMLVAGAEKNVTKNTHKATAFSKLAAEVEKKHGDGSSEEPIIGNPQRVKLPFACEEEIVDWEVQVFDNDDPDFIDELGSEELYWFVLSIDLVSTTKAHNPKKKGTLRKFTSPSKKSANDENMAEEG